MKKIMFMISALLLIHTLLFTDSIIDSVYAVPELDGNMCYTPTGQCYSLNSTTYAMYVGDIGAGASPPPNSSKRSFVSFELPNIPEGYEIDSVFIRLYQFTSHGVSYDDSTGYIHYDFPYWDTEGGDTVQCIMSHIDYGFELDPGDWAKGDEENPNTFNHNIGMITDSGIDGYRYLDVTSSVIHDYHLGRLLNQYRISFEIDTDWDDLSDNLAFDTGEHWDSRKPQLFFYLSEIVFFEDTNIGLNKSLFYIYPNPIKKNATISYIISQNSDVLCQFFNEKGQLMETIVNKNQASGKYSISWNTENHSSGVYFYTIKTGAQTQTGKCLLLK